MLDWNMVHIEKFERRAPFGHALYVHFGLYDVRFSDLPSKNRIERNYLAWETVRRKTNPYFVKGTGFEGYLVGTCESPSAALEAILQATQNILDAIARLYHFERFFRSRLMQTLSGEISDPESIHIWSAYLGAELGRLRVHIPRNKAAILFQNQTYQIVNLLPAMTYHTVEYDVMQNYSVGSVDNPVAVGMQGQAKVQVRGNLLNPSQQMPWLVATNIGRFGHPLVRKFLDTGW